VHTLGYLPLGTLGEGQRRVRRPPLEELGHTQAIACIVSQPLANFNVSANKSAASPRASCIAHLNTTQPTRLRCSYCCISVSTAYSVGSRLRLPLLAARGLAPTPELPLLLSHPNFVHADRHGVAVVRLPLQQQPRNQPRLRPHTLGPHQLGQERQGQQVARA